MARRAAFNGVCLVAAQALVVGFTVDVSQARDGCHMWSHGHVPLDLLNCFA